MGTGNQTGVDWKRAIYIDFEGRVKDPASFLGVECEGEWSVDVLESALWPAVERGHVFGAVRASSASDAFRRIQHRAESEGRAVVAWSRRELEEIVGTEGVAESERQWWKDNLVNAIPTAKRLARTLNIEIKSRPSAFGISSNKASLASFLEALGYVVPKIHGPGNSAKRILNVRRQFEKGRTFAELTPSAKRSWTNGLSHNFHDCTGMSFVMNELSKISQLGPIYLKTQVFIDRGSGLVPAADHHLMSGGIVHVLTAWNPGDERPSNSENESANERLRSRIIDRGLECFRAVGRDPDSTHEEMSWAVEGLTDKEARELGRDFGQVAVFRLLGDSQTVLGCGAEWSLTRAL